MTRDLVLGFVSSSLLASLAGSNVRDLTELTNPWTTRTRTFLVSFESGEPMIVQASHDARGIERRLRLGRQLRTVAPWLPIPEVIYGDVGATLPFVVSRFVDGQPGNLMLADLDGATALGGLAGALALDIQRVRTTGLRLSRAWSDPVRLALASRRWLERNASLFDSASIPAIADVVEHLPAVFDRITATLAHGDLAPVNLIVRDGVVAAVIDLERARLAHPLFDAAWFRAIVRHHHRAAWDRAAPAFMAAARMESTPWTTRVLDVLGTIQCLEVLDQTPRVQQSSRSNWAALALEMATSRP